MYVYMCGYMILDSCLLIMGFLRSSVAKASASNAGDQGSIPGVGSSPGEGNGYLLQYSCLENPMNRGACWARVHGITRVRHDLVVSFFLLIIPMQIVCPFY